MFVRFLLIAALLAAFPAAAAAQDAQTAFVERRGLLEADAQCRLLQPDVRVALRATASQARGALRGGGWTLVQLDELERATVRAARTRPCNDARTIAAVTQADASFTAWARAPSMSFPGWERSWQARRTPDPQGGWRLRQDITAPVSATFGVRDVDGDQQLVLRLTLGPNDTTPAGARLAMRDPARGPSLIGLPGRVATGLEAGAPVPVSTRTFLASARHLGAPVRGRRELVFVFPDAAFEAMLGLDPREAVEARWGDGPQAGRVLIEVGEIAAARAFLAAER